jgi:hypothetical protein
VTKSFPCAVTNKDLVNKVTGALQDFGYGENTLVATSLCCDEVSRILERDFSDIYTYNFTMGGLAGFAFGGVTAFGAMAHHIPDGGSCLIVYGPHVGVDADGNVGAVNRRGRAAPGACCGSGNAALSHVCSVCKGQSAPVDPAVFADPIQCQQAMVGHLLMPYAERWTKSPEPMAELPLALYDVQQKMMNDIVKAGCQEVHAPGKICLLGGIQINTPNSESDFFLPLDFELRTNQNVLVKDLLLTAQMDRLALVDQTKRDVIKNQILGHCA